MKQLALALLLVVSVVSPVAAQEGDVVATVNGEPITAARLNELWDSLSEEMATRYEAVGGKLTLLNNYIRKRLLLQDAARSGFEGAVAGKELPLAEESALFNRYVREHFGAQVVTDDMVAEYYAKHPDRFRHLEQTMLRHIFISTEDKTADEAREALGRVMSELHHKQRTLADKKRFADEFAAAATKYSEDPRTRQSGGSMGWRERVRLEEGLRDAAFTIAPGTMSGMLQTEHGFHLLLIEDRRPAGMETLANAAPAIRRTLVSRRAQDVVKAADRRTDELMASGDVQVFAENVQ